MLNSNPAVPFGAASEAWVSGTIPGHDKILIAVCLVYSRFR
jgi:hypothetical protein